MKIHKGKNGGSMDQLSQTDRIAVLIVEGQIERNILAQFLIDPDTLLIFGFLNMRIRSTWQKGGECPPN